MRRKKISVRLNKETLKKINVMSKKNPRLGRSKIIRLSLRNFFRRKQNVGRLSDTCQTYKREKWWLGFLGFLGFNGIPKILTQDWFGALWLLWFLWFLWFIPERRN